MTVAGPTTHDGAMATDFNAAAIVRDLEAADMGRRQAEVVTAACHRIATVAQPPTPARLDAALAKLEARLIRSMLVIAGAVVAVLKLIP